MDISSFVLQTCFLCSCQHKEAATKPQPLWRGSFAHRLTQDDRQQYPDNTCAMKPQVDSCNWAGAIYIVSTIPTHSILIASAPKITGDYYSLIDETIPFYFVIPIMST